ncbi:MAG: hypothetical protein RR460_09175 [Clostridium sp.]
MKNKMSSATKKAKKAMKKNNLMTEMAEDFKDMIKKAKKMMK